MFLNRFVFERGAYLKDNWNRLDFLIVTSSFLQELVPSLNVQVLRSLRILRPLRSIARFENLRNMIKVVLDSLSMMGDVFIIIIFFYLIFSITGL